MKVNDAVFKHVEAEIICYHETLQEIEGILNQPYLFPLSMLSLNKRLDFLEEISDLIQEAYDSGKMEHRKIMESYYWGGCKNWDDLAEMFQVSKNAVLNYRNELIYSIAYKLGWM